MIGTAACRALAAALALEMEGPPGVESAARAPQGEDEGDLPG